MDTKTNWPTGTQVGYYAICHRKLWLFAKDIQMEQESDRVALGKNIHEQSYPERREDYREWEHGPIKLDYFDPKKKIVHEIKLSKKMESAHEWQTKYYLYYLKTQGFSGAMATLEYPLLKQTTKVELSESDEIELIKIIEEINRIKQMSVAPPLNSKRTICKSCSYEDLCFAGEEKESSDAEE